MADFITHNESDDEDGGSESFCIEEDEDDYMSDDYESSYDDYDGSDGGDM